MVQTNFRSVEFIRLTDGAVLATLEDPDRWSPFWPKFSPGGRTAVVGSQEGIFTVFRIGEWLEGAPFGESVSRIEASVGPSHAGSAGIHYVASTHSGESVEIWDRDSLEPWFEIPISNVSVTQSYFAMDDRYMFYANGAELGVLRRLPLEPAELAAFAESRAQRGFTVEECERFLVDNDCSAYADE